MVTFVSKPKRGFTLIEVMVSAVLFLMVMLLLVKGVTAVTTTVTLGQRQSQLHRVLKNVRRVMQDDLESMIVHPDWPVFVGNETADPPQLMLAFLRYRVGTEGDNETEWVQYWREEHASEPARLDTWVRYSAPFANRRTHTGEGWWNAMILENGEVLVDDLIAIDLVVQSSERIESLTVTNQVEMVDVRVYLTVPPLPLVENIAPTKLKRMEDEEGNWMHFRCRPGFVAGPIVEEIPVEEIP